MPRPKPIATAPKDGRKVRLLWTDADGQQNESMGRFRSLEQVKAAGGDWDVADAGWWVFTDGNTQKRVDPTGWVADVEDDDE